MFKWYVFSWILFLLYWYIISIVLIYNFFLDFFWFLLQKKHWDNFFFCFFFLLFLRKTRIYSHCWLFLVSACECDPAGSAALHCERNTGKCECLPGIGGHKCDRCARGTTGQIPYCEPCGECFDNWDRIIEELKSELDLCFTTCICVAF